MKQVTTLWYLPFVFWIFTHLFSSCIFLNTFQSPVTLDKGATVLGGGVSGIGANEDGGGFGLPEVQIKHGLSDRVEIGGRLAPGAIGADLKWQFLKGNRFSMAFAGNVGVASWQFSESLDSHDTVFFSSSAAIIGGSEKFYGGLRTMTLGSDNNTEDANLTSLGTGFFLGGQLGKKNLKFIPEIGFYHNAKENGSFMSYGIALQYRFKK